MIEPIVSEEEWCRVLRDTPNWRPPNHPLLVIAPHPDDESLAAGGLIAALASQGVDITVVAATDGENAYGRNASLGPLRRKEQEAALARLGVNKDKIVRFELPDSGLESCIDDITRQLLPLVSEDTHLVAPWIGDFHPDHRACGLAAQTVADKKAATLSSYFFWTWHLGRTDVIEGLTLRSFLLSAESLRAKSDAIQCHRSQLAWEGEEPILSARLLAPVWRAFEVFSISGT
jgi:LmbE family N-acetylglucosaminyl deacetylase